jgi:hypothetical protein
MVSFFRHNKKYINTALPSALVCILLFFLPFIRQFVIIDYKTSKVLYSSDVMPGDKFSVTYIHSVNKSPVEDQFSVESDYGIMLQKTVFKSFGAGIPSNSGDGGEFTFYNDRIEVEYTGRKIEKLLMFVGVIADHHFLMNGRDIRLNELSLPQRSVQFLVKKITVYRYLKYIFNKQGGD